jgi:hypothetical protein
MTMIGAGLSIIPGLAGGVNVGQSLTRFQRNSGLSASITFIATLQPEPVSNCSFAADTWFVRRRMDA